MVISKIKNRIFPLWIFLISRSQFLQLCITKHSHFDLCLSPPICQPRARISAPFFHSKLSNFRRKIHFFGSKIEKPPYESFVFFCFWGNIILAPAYPSVIPSHIFLQKSSFPTLKFERAPNLFSHLSEAKHSEASNALGTGTDEMNRFERKWKLNLQFRSNLII